MPIRFLKSAPSPKFHKKPLTIHTRSCKISLLAFCNLLR